MTGTPFPCGHPRTAENEFLAFGYRIQCRTCDQHARDARWQALRERNAAMAAAYEAGEGVPAIAARHKLSVRHTEKILAEQGLRLTGNVHDDPLYPTRAIKVAATLAGASIPQLVSYWRAPKELVHARWCVMAALRERGMSLPQIGRRLNRDHSTVIYGLSQVGTSAARDPAFADMLQQVRAA